MAYCPLKLMAATIAEGLTSRTSELPPQLKVTGGYNAENECDKGQCGFWSTSAQACGIAAGQNVPLQPVPPPREDPADKPLVGGVTTT